jgi:NYN domain
MGSAPDFSIAISGWTLPNSSDVCGLATRSWQSGISPHLSGTTPLAEARQQVYLSALAAHSSPLLNIVHGRFQAKHQECRVCGTAWVSYEEKETDVNIAVSLVADAASAAADLALLISADSDLCPAIRTTRAVSATVGSRLGIVAAFPPRRYSHELKVLVPGAFTLAQADIRNSLLPEVVTDQHTGQKYRRPPKWT